MRRSLSLLSALPAPSLSMLDIISEVPVHRLPLLFAVIVTYSDAFALAVARMMDVFQDWIDLSFREQDDRETRNHNPWGDANGIYDPSAFEQ